jgi:hypothetical protein
MAQPERAGHVGATIEIRAELGELLIGTAPGRADDDEITVFESLGLAVEDLAAASFVYKKATDPRRKFKVAFQVAMARSAHRSAVPRSPRSTWARYRCERLGPYQPGRFAAELGLASGRHPLDEPSVRPHTGLVRQSAQLVLPDHPDLAVRGPGEDPVHYRPPFPPKARIFPGKTQLPRIGELTIHPLRGRGRRLPGRFLKGFAIVEVAGPGIRGADPALMICAVLPGRGVLKMSDPPATIAKRPRPPSTKRAEAQWLTGLWFAARASTT